MKRILIFILFILFQKILFAQNWAPLISVDKYNFRLDTNSVVASAIWVDSTQLLGLDSIYYLNRTRGCEHCLTWINGGGFGPPICDSCYGLKGLPEFLQKKCIIHPNGVYQFLGPDNLVINSLSSVGNSWTFDSSLNIIANVISIGVDSVFGNIDSVKSILLSSGDTIRLCKNYGLLQFPNGYSQNSYYHLTGIDGRNVGEIIPMFSDFFNFNIGDMFEYIDSSCTLDYYIRKYIITSKQIIGDSIVYGISGLRKIWGSHGVHYLVLNSPLTVINNVKHITNSSYNDQMQLAYQYNNLYGHIKFSTNSLNLFVKEIGGTSGNGFLHYPISNQSDTMEPNAIYASRYYKYVVGLGETDVVANDPWSGYGSTHLTAYRKGFDTVGVFTPDSILTGTTGMNGLSDINKFITIYPNPSSASITINVNHFINENSRITISDMENRIVLSDDFSNSMQRTLDVSSFANGIYMLKIVTGDDTFIKKLVVQ